MGRSDAVIPGWFGIALAVGLTAAGLATYHPGVLLAAIFGGIFAFTLWTTRPPPRAARSRVAPRSPRPRRPRFPIWWIMAVAVPAALTSAFAREVGPVAIAWVIVFGGVIWYLCVASSGSSKLDRKGVVMFGLSKKERRAKVLETPFPAEWAAILDRNVPISGKLPIGDRGELQGLIQVFLAEKVFEGCVGLKITDEIRVTIAAQACLLLLRRETDIYPKLITVLVYPSAYVSEMPRHTPQGLVIEGPRGRLGEAWTSGVVVLSWDDVRLGAADVRDGHNVVIHEFAHQLDQEDGAADGAPILRERSHYTAWGRVLGAEYQELREAAEKGKKSVLDEYGATEPAEFFAVATEAFFEKPVQLKKKYPELYEELKTYYAQDPEAEYVADLAGRSGPRPKL